jgi:hypothetical protein
MPGAITSDQMSDPMAGELADTAGADGMEATP